LGDYCANLLIEGRLIVDSPFLCAFLWPFLGLDLLGSAFFVRLCDLCGFARVMSSAFERADHLLSGAISVNKSSDRDGCFEIV
jgi:hypothetical protein